MMMRGVGEDDTKGRARPLPTVLLPHHHRHQVRNFRNYWLEILKNRQFVPLVVASWMVVTTLYLSNLAVDLLRGFFGLSFLIGITTEGSSTHQSAIATRACCQNTG